jgi:hypothetical protein
MRIFIVEFEIIFWGDTDLAERPPAFTQFRATAGAAQISEPAARSKGTAAEAHVPAHPSADRNANSEAASMHGDHDVSLSAPASGIKSTTDRSPSFISLKRGRGSHWVNLETVVNLMIGGTRTRIGLKMRAILDKNPYETGVGMSDEESDRL